MLSLCLVYDGISEQQMLRLSIMYKECWKHTFQVHIQVDHIHVIWLWHTVIIVTMQSEVQVTGVLASPCIHVNLSPKGFEFQNVFLNVAAHCFVYPWDQNVTFECHLSISCMTLDCLHLHPNPPCSSYVHIRHSLLRTFTSLKPEKQVLSIHLCLDRMSLINFSSPLHESNLNVTQLNVNHVFKFFISISQKNLLTFIADA